MSRWLFAGSCMVVMLGLFLTQSSAYPRDAHPTQSPERRGEQALGARCGGDMDCTTGLECLEIRDVLQAQCAAGCSSTDSCRLRFGPRALCIGADVCVQVCEVDRDCPQGTVCNRYAWCERS